MRGAERRANLGPTQTMNPLSKYLTESACIDFRHPAVAAKAIELAAGAVSHQEIAGRAFQFVRDEIRHSGDVRQGPITCRASDVLLHGVGYCYAKSHLLTALLRANGFPAGLCYQRLSIAGNGSPYCLHGLVAAHLPDQGWYRIDPRGNKPGVHAEFSPPVERLAFKPTQAGEFDLPAIFAEPLDVVVAALQRNRDIEALEADLPDYPVETLREIASTSE